MTAARLELTRAQILAFRRRVGALDERLPAGAASLRRAAWAGLQDSMPRAALLSIHARVEGTGPATWEDPSLVQIWGPRYSVFVVAKPDLAIFTLGVLPDDAKGRERAVRTAQELATALAGRRMGYGEARQLMGVHHNSLRYAAATGTVLIRWEGARQPTVWTVPAPARDPHEARRELARRYLHIYGPTTPEAFGDWAGLTPRRSARRSMPFARPSCRSGHHSATVGPSRKTRTPCAWVEVLPLLRGSSRAATPFFSCTGQTAISWSRRRSTGTRSGRRASGPAACSSAGMWSAPGGAQMRS